MPRDKKQTAVLIGVGVAAVAGVILLTAAKKPPPPLLGLANLHGQVTDAITRTPLAGVLITLNGLETLTDSAGNYIFDDLAPGSYEVSFIKDGYETAVF